MLPNFHNHFRSRCARAGYTIVELMVAGSVGAFILAGVLSTYVYAVKGFRAIGNYVEIHQGGRRAVDQFSQDVRGVSGITAFSSTNLIMTIPTAFNNTGGAISNKTVSYYLKSGTLFRTDTSTGITNDLCPNIYQLTFTLYDRIGSNTSLRTIAKGIQVDIQLRKYVMSQIESEDYLSARLDMRNTP